MDIKFTEFNKLSADELYDIMYARQAVFVVEQNCPYFDMDGKDKGAVHVTLKVNGELKAYVRIINEDGKTYIGRVITLERKRGYGEKIMRAALDYISKHYGNVDVFVEAQVQAKGFYEKCGFKQISDEYLIDNIPHIEMVKEKEIL